MLADTDEYLEFADISNLPRAEVSSSPSRGGRPIISYWPNCFTSDELIGSLKNIDAKHSLHVPKVVVAAREAARRDAPDDSMPSTARETRIPFWLRGPSTIVRTGGIIDGKTFTPQLTSPVAKDRYSGCVT